MHPPSGLEAWTHRAYSAEEIEAMTLAEIDLILTPAKEFKPEGFTPVPADQMNAWAERQFRLGVDELLKEARGE